MSSFHEKLLPKFKVKFGLIINARHKKLSWMMHVNHRGFLRHQVNLFDLGLENQFRYDKSVA